jgi:hypothetical protein
MKADCRTKEAEGRHTPEEPEGLEQAPRGSEAAETEHTPEGVFPCTERAAPEFRADIPVGGQAQNHVVRQGRLTGTMHLIAFDADGNVIGHFEGNQRQVGFSEELKRALFDPASRVVIHYNHPNNSATSVLDISQLGLPGLYAIWAHGHEGVVSRIELTYESRASLAKMPADARMQQLYWTATRVDDEVYKLLAQEAMQGRITPKEAEEYQPHLTNEVLRRAGIVDYRSNVDLAETNLAKLGLEGFQCNRQARTTGLLRRYPPWG